MRGNLANLAIPAIAVTRTIASKVEIDVCDAKNNKGENTQMNRAEKRELLKDENLLKGLVKVINNCFPELKQMLKKTESGRDTRYIRYGAEEIIVVRIFGFLMGLESMNQITEKFNRDECIENISKILKKEGMEELPHYDTINDFFEGIDIEKLKEVNKYLVTEIIKRRMFEKNRYLGKYYIVAVDGTEIYRFDEKHCEHCLTSTYTDEKTGEKRTYYYHRVLEAKLVLGNIVISLGSEFIENEKEDVDKQDCELRAFYRLAKKIKKEYSRLQIVLLGDSLYACDPVVDVCKKSKWEYILRVKEGRKKNLYKEYKKIKTTIKGAKGDYEIANDVVDEKKTHNVLGYKEDDVSFTWIVSFTITVKNKKEIMETGRMRWKIENEGFNTQKNHGYNLEHVYSYNYNAEKAHYLIMQIAHTIRQIGELGITQIKKLRLSLKEISFKLLECFRSTKLTEQDIFEAEAKMQIRIET